METINQQLDTFPKLLQHHAMVRPNKPAIREKSKGIWQTQTWKEFSDTVYSLAGGLASQGFKRGDHLVLVADNRPRFYAAMCATQLLGGVAMPLYEDAIPAELVLPIQNAEATHVFAQDQEQVDKILEILPQCPTVKHIIYDEDRGLRRYTQPELSNFVDMLALGREFNASHNNVLDAELALGKGSDVASMFYTSGTTGVAKGVVLTHAALIDRARAAAELEHLTDEDAAIAYLPPAWIGQNIFAYAQPLVVGYCVCCPESSETMLADMREIGPSYFFAPPRVLEALVTQVAIRMEDAGKLKRAMYEHAMKLAQRVGTRMLANESVSIGDRLAYWLYDLLVFGPLRDVLGMSRIRVAYIAGEAISPDLIVFFRSIGINLKQLYGSTETSIFVCIQPDGQVKSDTVGVPLKGVELKFTEQRELLVRSPGLFKEYHKNPQATQDSKDLEGWFRTGDAGYIGEDGHLRIIDRVKDVGTFVDGTMFAPKRLENKLKFFPFIREAVAFGQGRENVCAFINIDMEAVGNWADRHNISYTGHTDLASRDEVYELIAKCIEQANQGLALEPALSNSQIGRFLLLHKELEADDGELTRTRKVRRGYISDQYQTLVDAMYAGDSSVMVNAEVRYEDGRVATVSAEVKIRDAKTFPSATQLKAA